MKVPVRPIPLLEWTRMGDDVAREDVDEDDEEELSERTFAFSAFCIASFASIDCRT